MRAVRPGLPALRTAAGLLGIVLVAAGGLHLPAIVTAFALGEVNDGTAMTVGACLGVLAGLALASHRRRGSQVDPGTGAVVVASAWLAVPAVVAVSFHLSGHSGSPTDAYFDAMSGLTTSGLSILQDLDHLGIGMQVLRHTLHFAGGQGIVLVVLTLLESRHGGLGTLMSGEGRDERLVPNVLRTARLIYLIAAAWLVVGTAANTLVLLREGFSPGRALVHGLLLFVAAFDTGGFSMMSTSVAYYHSATLEAVLAVLMVAGALSFPVHYALWRRRTTQVSRNLGVRTFMATTAGLTAVLLVGLGANSVLDAPDALLRTGVFTALSAATGTGFTVVPGSVYGTWGQLAPAALVTLMGIGAMAGSTAGGIKVERLALLGKSVVRDVRRALLPPDAVLVTTRRGALGGRAIPVPDDVVRSAAVIVLLFLLTYVVGALVSIGYGTVATDAIFESVSATATVGLSVGVAAPGAPWLVKVTMIVQMWLGRLEFLAAFALAGWTASQLRGGVAHLRRHLTEPAVAE